MVFIHITIVKFNILNYYVNVQYLFVIVGP